MVTYLGQLTATIFEELRSTVTVIPLVLDVWSALLNRTRSTTASDETLKATLALYPLGLLCLATLEPPALDH